MLAPLGATKKRLQPDQTRVAFRYRIGRDQANRAEQGVLHRQESPILAIQEEHHSQQHREQTCVQVLVFALQRFAKQPRAISLVGRSKPGQQYLESLEHLPGQLVGDICVSLATLCQNRRKLVLRSHAEPALATEEHHESIEDRPPADGLRRRQAGA